MDKIAEIIKYYSESHNIDFKLLQYPIENHEKKNQILKDISAMANHLSEEDKYIIIGVKRKKGGDIKYQDVLNPIDQASYQQFLDSNIEPQINFEYNTTIFEGHQISYFKIFNNTQRPYLFKNDIRNLIDPKKYDFKKGDGFIRKGTSTYKMVLDDFERIYEIKYKKPDRKSDIKITPFIGEYEDGRFSESNIRYFDFKIENLSSQSINLEVELKIYYNSDVKFVSKRDFEMETSRQRSSVYASNVNSIFSHVHFENYSDFIKVTRVKLRMENSALKIEQNDVEEEVFFNEILVYSEKSPSKIKAILSLRSDSFSDGLLTKNIEFEI